MREALAVAWRRCARGLLTPSPAAAEALAGHQADPALAGMRCTRCGWAPLRTKVMRDSSPLVRALADTEQRLASAIALEARLTQQRRLQHCRTQVAEFPTD